MRWINKDRFGSNYLWIGAAAIITILYLVLYIVVQQSLRYAADEPQKSMALDFASGIISNLDTTKRNPQVPSKERIEMSGSKAPFIIIYDQYGKVVDGNGYLSGSIPQVPIGVLAASKEGKTHAVTWQPRDDVRIATVSTKAGPYYILGGRSLSVVEKQTSRFGWFIIVAWVITLLGLFGLYRFFHRKPKPTEVKS